MLALREVVPVSAALRFCIEIHHDEDVPNPRTEFDHLAEFWCWHRRYNLGDNKPRMLDSPVTREGVIEHVQDSGDDVLAILPLYLYDHSGITISTSPFSCRWDSGQVGWAFVRSSTAEEQGIGRDVEKALKVIHGEVAEYDQYLRGDVFGYVLAREQLDSDEDVAERVEMESCWGCYGMDYCIEQARDTLHHHRQSLVRTRIDRLKTMIQRRVPLDVRMEKLGPYFG